MVGTSLGPSRPWQGELTVPDTRSNGEKTCSWAPSAPHLHSFIICPPPFTPGLWVSPLQGTREEDRTHGAQPLASGVWRRQTGSYSSAEQHRAEGAWRGTSNSSPQIREGFTEEVTPTMTLKDEKQD